MNTIASKRNFIPHDYVVTEWKTLQPYFEELKGRTIQSANDLWQWCKDRSELESVLEEDMGWRYIRMTCDTANTKFTEEFNFFVSEIQPEISPFTNDLNHKILNSPYLNQLQEDGFEIAKKLLQKDALIYREENIALFTEVEQEAHKFGAISGAMTVTIEGKELTMQKASDILLDLDRAKRQNAYQIINERRLVEKDKLNDLYTHLIKLRHQIALNAGYLNFRDYMFTALGRFDYTPNDCFQFHEAIKLEVMPVINQMAIKRKNALTLDSLRPWDLSLNYQGKAPLKPFENSADLLSKTIQCFNQIDTFFGDCLTTMQELNHLDLDSRKGKAPGGYNYPLDEIGIPFIFMNATNTVRDLVTMVHEGGHAIHSFLVKDLPINTFKHPTSEVAELASMSMELISMEHWDVFFEQKEDYKRAKIEHLESILHTLPWVAIIDQFQHWVYENHNHTLSERQEKWLQFFSALSNSETDWTGLEHFKAVAWQKQLHLFEVPFYYIEYAIAQLGAIAVWRNYKINAPKALADYKAALKLGYTKPIQDIYTTAGIKFDFSKEYIRELVSFVRQEMITIENS